MKRSHVVRPVAEADLPELVALEQKRWGRIPGTPPLDLETLRKWYDMHSPYFLVVTLDGVIVAYYFGYRVAMNSDENYLKLFNDCPHIQELGVADIPQDSTGATFYGINITSVDTHAANLIHTEIITMLQAAEIEIFLGVSRISTLSWYVQKCPDQMKGNVVAIALHYVTCSVNLSRGIKTEGYLDLPNVNRPDPVIRYHVNLMPVVVLGIIPYLAEDTKSCGLGVLLLSRYPFRI